MHTTPNHATLLGMPVLVLRRGLYPNKQEVLDVQASWPGHTVRCEALASPNRFALTVRKQH